MFEWWCQKIVFLNGGTSYCINNFRHETNIKRVNRALLNKPSSKHTCILTICYYIWRGKNEFLYLKTTIRRVIKMLFCSTSYSLSLKCYISIWRKRYSLSIQSIKKIGPRIKYKRKTMQLIFAQTSLYACVSDR